MANCVGKRNYRYFFTFLIITSLLTIIAFGICLWHLIDVGLNSEGETIGDKILDALRTTPLRFIFLVHFLFHFLKKENYI